MKKTGSSIRISSVGACALVTLTTFVLVGCSLVQGSEEDSSSVGEELTSAPTAPVTLQATAMSTKTTGEREGSVWNVWSNGYVANAVTFSTDGTYPMTVTAYGSPAAGVWPHMEIRVDQVAVASFTVNSATPRTYRVNAKMVAGRHQIAVAFTNDLWIQGVEDRNLYVQSVAVAAATPAPAPPPTPPPTVDGACGSAKGVAALSAPSTGLCSAGTASTVSGSGPFIWTCVGSGGGSTASCSAPRQSGGPVSLVSVTDGHWFTDGPWQPAPSLNAAISTSVGYNGSPSWVVTGNATSGNTGVDRAEIAIKPGDVIEYSAWIKTSAATLSADVGNPQAGGRIGLDVYSSSGFQLSRGVSTPDGTGSSNDSFNTYVPFGNDWTHVTMRFQVAATYTANQGSSAGQTFVPVGVIPWLQVWSDTQHVAEGGTAWFSDVQFFINP
jgi:hypothetical protein